MRTLTHRSNLNPAQTLKQEKRPEPSCARRIIQGQKVHLSGRSMWRGYWYGKGPIAKWNRAEQVLTGMKLSYYRGKQVQISQISLLETHHAASSTAQKGIDSEKGERAGSSHGAHSQAEGTIPAAGQHCRMVMETEHSHEGRRETAHPDPHPPAQDAARMETRHAHAPGTSVHPDCNGNGPHVTQPVIWNSTGAAGIAATPATIADSPPHQHQARQAFHPQINQPMPPASGAETQFIPECPPAQQMRIGSGTAQEHSHAAGFGNRPMPGTAPFIQAFSDAASSVISSLAALAAWGGAGHRKGHDSAMQGNMGAAAQHQCDLGTAQAPFQAHLSQGAPENLQGFGGQPRHHLPHVGSQKRKSAQLKVARADAIPPQ